VYDLPPAYAREPRNWKLGLLMVLCFAALGGIIVATGVREPQRGNAPAVSDGDGSYKFSFTQPNGRTPVGFDPCAPIRVEINPDGAPDEHEELVRTAMAHISEASGLRFDLVGTTDSRRFLDSRATWDRGPSIVGWSTEDEYDELEGDVAGVGGSTMVQIANRRRLTTGAVVLDAEVFDELLDAGLDEEAQAIVDHEFGHLVGLDHVDDAGELMYRENTGRTTWGPGDREGLARLGGIRCG
jgi:Matrixin